MKKTLLSWALLAALMLSLAGCGLAPAAETKTPAEEPQAETAAPAPAEDAGQAEASETSEPAEAVEPAAETARQDGERFETVIILEGMEETVHYEHVKNAAFGFEVDYDYENFVRTSYATCERFISVWDDPANPENYIDVSCDTGNYNLVADAINAKLSAEYDTTVETVELDGAGSCIHIEAAVIKGTNQMADQLQEVYVIPAPDGCRIATAHTFVVDSEGMLHRFNYMLNTLTVLDRGMERTVSDDMALTAVKAYCFEINPELEGIVSDGEHQVSWTVSSSDEEQIVVLYLSYTGAEVRYYIDRATGDAYSTEFVPGITSEEQRTEESFNVWDYIG